MNSPLPLSDRVKTVRSSIQFFFEFCGSMVCAINKQEKLWCSFNFGSLKMLSVIGMKLFFNIAEKWWAQFPDNRVSLPKTNVT